MKNAEWGSIKQGTAVENSQLFQITDRFPPYTSVVFIHLTELHLTYTIPHCVLWSQTINTPRQVNYFNKMEESLEFVRLMRFNITEGIHNCCPEKAAAA